MQSFNLVTEKWIPVLFNNGTWRRVGIREALLESGKIRQISASNPMDNVALLRFLLAVLLWCRPEAVGDEERKKLAASTTGVPQEWLTGGLGAEGMESAAFDLFDGGRAFLQAPPDTDSKQTLCPVASIYQELPGGTNIAHFHRILDYRDGACPSCIAIGLVRLSPAAGVGGQGHYPGINGDPPLYFLQSGMSLLDALSLNLPRGWTEGDAPCWWDPPNHGPVGVLEGFTWTPRQFRIPSELQSGRCVVCGDFSDQLATGLLKHLHPNGRSELSRAEITTWRDPHLIYDEKGKPVRAVNTEKNLPAAAARWRKLTALTMEHCRPLRGRQEFLAAGLAMSQAKGIEALEHRLSTDLSPVSELGDAVDSILDPRVSARGKEQAAFKDRHPLRHTRGSSGSSGGGAERKDPSLCESVRAAMASHLPGLEFAMNRAVISTSGEAMQLDRLVEVTGWEAVIDIIVRSTKPGSPLRRLEAQARARRELSKTIRKLLPPPSAEDPRSEATESQIKQRTPRRKRGDT